MSTKKPYSLEFKLKAIELVRVSSEPISTIATKLGVHRNTLHKWGKKVSMSVSTNKDQFCEKITYKELEQENKKLFDALKKSKEECNFLSKTVLYFAKQ